MIPHNIVLFQIAKSLLNYKFYVAAVLVVPSGYPTATVQIDPIK